MLVSAVTLTVTITVPTVTLTVTITVPTVTRTVTITVPTVTLTVTITAPIVTLTGADRNPSEFTQTDGPVPVRIGHANEDLLREEDARVRLRKSHSYPQGRNRDFAEIVTSHPQNADPEQPS